MYKVQKNPPEEVQKELGIYDDLTQRLLYSRGITSKKEASMFLERTWFNAEPFKYVHMEKAVNRVLDAIEKKEMIGIYSDYDSDGIPAAAALTSTLLAYEHKNLTYFVPHRNKDGFGLNKRGIKHIVDSKATVCFVLDCGTSDPEHVKQLTDKGIDVIIIDHHLAGDIIPDAYAIINPLLQEGISEPHPCAAGITYLFLQALIEKANERGNTKLPIGWEKWQLDLIAFATISDMVPLHKLNRQLVHYGIEVARKSPRPGLQALCKEIKVKQENLNQDDISFYIVPRINAASRMGEADIAYKLLIAEDIEEATSYAKQLTALNNTRKKLIAQMTKEAHNQARHKLEENSVWVIGSRKWKPSMVGLVAQKISSEYKKTVYAWGQSDEENPKIKGSYRTSQCNAFLLSQKIEDVFEEVGGHEQAGGFTLLPGAELYAEDSLNQDIDQDINEDPLIVDSECTVQEVHNIFKKRKSFEPFGTGNRPITVALKGSLLREVTRFGKGKEHVQYVFSDGNRVIRGVTFFCEEDFSDKEGDPISTVLGEVEYDSFKRTPRIKVLKII